MKQLRKLAFVAVLGTLLAASALAQSGPVYLRSNTALPWNVTANEEAMDMVFGADSWIYGRYETVDANWLFSSTVTLIFMEGGDNNANALSAFLTANADALNSWVEAGGRLLINAAPNEGNSINVGFGATLRFDDGYNSAGTSGHAVDASHPVVTGPFTPVGNSFPANYFSHAYLGGEGFTAILNDDSDRPVLGEKQVGSGLVLVGGMTSDVFQNPQPNTHNLRANIIQYTATKALSGN